MHLHIKNSNKTLDFHLRIVYCFYNLGGRMIRLDYIKNKYMKLHMPSIVSEYTFNKELMLREFRYEESITTVFIFKSFEQFYRRNVDTAHKKYSLYYYFA